MIELFNAKDNNHQNWIVLSRIRRKIKKTCSTFCIYNSIAIATITASFFSFCCTLFVYIRVCTLIIAFIRNIILATPCINYFRNDRDSVVSSIRWSLIRATKKQMNWNSISNHDACEYRVLMTTDEGGRVHSIWSVAILLVYKVA